MDGKQFAKAKLNLKTRLDALRSRLNEFLAGEYGIDPNKEKEYANWLESHQPFHWFVEFYGIIIGGGFDVTIGNPPYVEYREVLPLYHIRSYETLPCGNLYAFVWERCLNISDVNGHVGFIIPVASICTSGYNPLQRLWSHSGDLVISSFADRPGKLFEGLEHIRLSIVLLSKSPHATRKAFSTHYYRWLSESRHILFDNLVFVDVSNAIKDNMVPKFGSPLDISLFNKLLSSKSRVQDFTSPSGKHIIYYTRKLSWFVQILAAR